jgi:hypothetical protein
MKIVFWPATLLARLIVVVLGFAFTGGWRSPRTHRCGGAIVGLLFLVVGLLLLVRGLL